MKDISRKRHVAKTITWRLIATGTTVILAWLISGDPMIGLKVGGWEFLIKMGLYYLHERAWYKVDFGLIKRKFKKWKND
ncbi:hypothetical protein CXF68_06785 [Tenacibaculum sp. Bg11-29]|uniref:DUF2061 domain-containing protein n=1 Tax=Tenacibaculum sp. Bg11-29 TaxID=2058306 RepID=UPI000C31FEE1|nr:DUF2061 domain-containing protein [Tenacibaculum sp. Bg11-29]PKH50417.1 hypothetical protein CXF68_06785 [Tenacibaculum sp. Bg11-29]